ncbi:hypothetical protein NLI96_g11092 [Meripilus lineatus]|uniref:Uncharacterized protein n=1 Tax=Meripilus lineatus TaxID=2056292 RepID=A0AAD5USQ7_9APHY|nr:hypothetical protein NLI96_g11092 [Physisporinus lineatus]
MQTILTYILPPHPDRLSATTSTRGLELATPDIAGWLNPISNLSANKSLDINKLYMDEHPLVSGSQPSQHLPPPSFSLIIHDLPAQAIINRRWRVKEAKQGL